MAKHRTERVHLLLLRASEQVGRPISLPHNTLLSLLMKPLQSAACIVPLLLLLIGGAFSLNSGGERPTASVRLSARISDPPPVASIPLSASEAVPEASAPSSLDPAVDAVAYRPGAFPGIQVRFVPDPPDHKIITAGTVPRTQLVPRAIEGGGVMYVLDDTWAIPMSETGCGSCLAAGKDCTPEHRQNPPTTR